MKFKKIVFVLIVLIIAIINCKTAYAKDDYSLKTNVIIDEEEIKLVINIDEAKLEMVGMQGTLNYNNNVLELKELNSKKEGWNVTALNKETGAFLYEITDELFYDKTAYLKAGDEVLEAVFNIKNKKNTEVKMTDVKVVNLNFETIEISDNNVKIKLQNATLIVVIVVAILICVLIIAIVIKKKMKK